MNELSIVIPAAGLGRRMKSYGPKSLLDVNGETLLARQIRILSESLPGVGITVVGGFEHHRIFRGLPSHVERVINPQYETTNVAFSLSIGLSCVTTTSVLIVYGDLVFNHQAVTALDFSRSGVVVHNDVFRSEEVGAGISDEGIVTHFSYGLPTKWAHIAILNEPEQWAFLDLASHPDRKRLFTFEVMNEIIERGGTFQALYQQGMRLVEVDSSRDIIRAKQIDL